MKICLNLGLVFGLYFGFAAAAPAGLATFDDLPTLPPTTSATGLFFANNSSSDYQGVTWDSRVTVVGDEYRVDTTTPGPLFGIPKSGDYFITNDGQNNQGILLTTSQVLTWAWFGRNEYYGFGAGADQVTIYALSNSTELASVVFDLPAPAVAGQPGEMGFVDTSIFLTLSGITGYRIDRRELGEQSGNWVADDFQFVSAVAVPEPPFLYLAATGMAVWLLARSRRRFAFVVRSR